MRPDARGTLDAQHALGAYIRDPIAQPVPAGVEPRRARIYADVFFNNVESLLGSTFPVIRATLGDERWPALVRDFLREHDARTAVFTELARELLQYLDARDAAGHDDPPWLRELAHYEWVELALQLSDAHPRQVPHDAAGDLRSGVPVLSPLAWPLAYDWPVHRIGPACVPTSPQPTLLLVHRRADAVVAFHELGAVAFHLLQALERRTNASGEVQLLALADLAGADDPLAFVDEGIALLERYRDDRIVLGTRAGN